MRVSGDELTRAHAEMSSSLKSVISARSPVADPSCHFLMASIRTSGSSCDASSRRRLQM